MNQETQKNTLEEFFDKAKSKPWVIDIYHAIQAAMALGVKDVDDFNSLADSLQPRPNRQSEAPCPLGEDGLALLDMIYVCECVEKGVTDYHEYKFTRRTDGKSATGTIKV